MPTLDQPLLQAGVSTHRDDPCRPRVSDRGGSSPDVHRRVPPAPAILDSEPLATVERDEVSEAHEPVPPEQDLSPLAQELGQDDVAHTSHPQTLSWWAASWRRIVNEFFIREINAQRILRSNLATPRGRKIRREILCSESNPSTPRTEEKEATRVGMDPDPGETDPRGRIDLHRGATDEDSMTHEIGGEDDRQIAWRAADRLIPQATATIPTYDKQPSPFAVIILAKSPGLRRYEVGPVLGNGQETHIRWHANFDAPDWLGETLPPGQRLRIGHPGERTPTPRKDHRTGAADDITQVRWMTSAQCHTCG